MKKIKVEIMNDGQPAIWETCGKTAIIICDKNGNAINPSYLKITRSQNKVILVPVEVDDIVIKASFDRISSLKVEVFQIISFFEEDGGKYAGLKRIAYFHRGKTDNKEIITKYAFAILSAVHSVQKAVKGEDRNEKYS